MVYCIEEADNGSNLSDISIPIAGKLTTQFNNSLLEGVAVIKGSAHRTSNTAWDDDILYKAAVNDKKDVTITAVPYCLWGNRGVGEMLVWIRTE